MEYHDGFTRAALMLGDNGYVGGFAYAAKCGKSIDAMEYHTTAARQPCSATWVSTSRTSS